MSVNKVILIGRLGDEPKSHQFQDGNMVVNVSLATSERWTDKQTGERKEMTEWHRLVFSNRLAEIAQQYLHKGSKIYVEGGIRTKKWQDQNGQDRYSTEIRVQNMTMLDSKNSMDQGGGYPSQGSGQSNDQGYPNQSNQNQGFQNQGQPQQQTYQNQSNPNTGNSFNQPPQTHQAQQPPQAHTNPTAPAMSDAPADDDIPF